LGCNANARREKRFEDAELFRSTLDQFDAPLATLRCRCFSRQPSQVHSEYPSEGLDDVIQELGIDPARTYLKCGTSPS
jgi:hypothetical protein